MENKQAQSHQDGPQTLLSSEGRGWKGLDADFLQVPGGVSIHASMRHRLCIHFGRAANTIARCDSLRHLRIQGHGDFDVIPAGLEGRVDGGHRTFLRLMVAPELVQHVAHDLDRDPDKAFLRPKFKSRDAQLEGIAWAIKAELESDIPSDRLYAESLSTALAVRLVAGLDVQERLVFREGQALSTQQRKRLLDHIENHLDQPLTLVELAAVASLSVSHLKSLFRRSFGMPVHQYVVRARVERAKQLLLEGAMPMSQAALEAGFSHQSHMARCMRQVLGVTPSMIAKLRG